MTDTPILQPTTPGDDTARMLRERGIEFSLQRISLDQVDRETSKHNQARFLPLHEDVVMTYGAAMEAGDIFPPIVLNGTGRKLVVLDGNHRVAAADLVGYKETTAFVATKITPAAAELFTFEANARHGLPSTIEERLAQGVYLVSIGNRAKEVARALSVPEDKLYRAIATKRGGERLVKVGVKPDLFSDHLKRRLDSVTSNVVLRPVADIAIKAKLGADEINDLVVAVNKFGTEAEQLAVVEDAKVRYAGRVRSTSGGRVSLPKNITRINLAARMIRHIEVGTLPKEIGGLDDDIAKGVRRELFESINTLVTASEALGR